MSNLASELNDWPHHCTNNFSLENCLFDTFKLVRNAIKSKFFNNYHGMAFGGEVSCSFGNEFTRNVVI